jgi:hypothetical protein
VNTLRECAQRGGNYRLAIESLHGVRCSFSLVKAAVRVSYC